jgi:FkbM family methyltransferase
MKIFYGYDDQHYINVTSVIFDKCFKDNVLVIPKEDRQRCDIVGFDPYPGILKHILIVDYNKHSYKFSHTQECKLQFDAIIKQLQEYHPKDWWNRVGKHMIDPKERLEALHRHLYFEHGNWLDEYPEQLLAVKYIKEDAKVLEVGGNIGRNSLIISTILKDPSQLVVMECDANTVTTLKQNLERNQYNTHVEPSALSYSKLLQHKWDTIPLSEAKEEHKNWKEVPTITFEEVEKKYHIQFDTIVADCEGSLYYVLKENPSMLDNIRMIIMENDYHDMDHKQMVDAILYLKGFARCYHMRGGWGPFQDFFYEVWTK